MAIRKFTRLQLNPDDTWVGREAEFNPRLGKLADFEFTPEPGFLYVTTRAISSRVNANYDGWPPNELRQAYKTFIGRPVYVDHNNWDLSRSRGVIIDSKLYETKLASGHEDVWVELLIEVDAHAFPRLAKAIQAGDIDAVSMGADVEYTVCSVCDNKAHDVLQYCAHIPQLKGRKVSVPNDKTGSIQKLCYEDCFGVSFFEISFVFDPADESALISDVFMASASDRTIAHVRGAAETVEVYTQRMGTSLSKVSAVSAPTMCINCGSNKFSFTGSVATCNVCKTADKTLMALPEQVDTLRDELDCPQCGSEWNGMMCTNCGFELPPEGLGDPQTDQFGLGVPAGPPPAEADEEGDEEEEEDSESDDEDSEEDTPRDKADAKHEDDDSDSDKPFSKSDDSKSDSKSKSDKSKSKSKGDSKKDDKSKKGPPKKDKSDSAKSKDDAKSDKGKAKKDDTKKKSAKEELNVSRFSELQKQATLPQDPPYRQDTSPANSVPGYGEAIPGGTPVQGVEPALEPAPAAHAELRDLDAPDVVAPVGQSAVTVPAQPAGPTSEPPAGPAAGAAVNKAGSQVEASQEEARSKFYLARAEALRERAAEFEKRAEVVTQTDVRALDEPPAVNVGPDATIDPLKATDNHEQLALADTTDVINDGSETGMPAVRDRLPQQVNPFNDAALVGYSPVQQQVASVEETDEERTQKEATREAEVEARIEQRVAAERTRTLRISNFVDERIDMGLTTTADKFNDIERFEVMDDATFDGYVEATREFKAKDLKLAGRRPRRRVAASEDTGPVRMPSLGSASRPVEVQDDPADDYMTFMSFTTN